METVIDMFRKLGLRQTLVTRNGSVVFASRVHFVCILGALTVLCPVISAMDKLGHNRNLAESQVRCGIMASMVSIAVGITLS